MGIPLEPFVPEKPCESAPIPCPTPKLSKKARINSDIFLDRLKFFVSNILPTRPVLLIQDGHATHISIDPIKFAKANNIHMLCLPSHMTHILQPLDAGVFKSFKTNFSKSCSSYISKHPGRVVTADILSALVAEAWPISFTTLNIMSGFRKCGLFPHNPSAVDDRQMAPSKALVARESKTIETVPNVPSSDSITDNASDASSVDSPVFTIEKEELYGKRFQEGFDIPDPGYAAWLKINHPEIALSTTGTSTTMSSKPNSASRVDKQQVASSDVLHQVLVLPVPQQQKQRQREGVTTRRCCITDMLDELKENEKRRRDEKEMKLAKQLEKEENRRMKALEKEQKQKEHQKAKEEKLKEKEAKLLEKQQRQREKEEKREAKQREKEEKRD
ncbi:PREDICTED: stress response protein NST1-like [Amphimedon queenslandica]|uniref:DDE-1 domain-containing protein n=1 Tax=Amphimedon queenslandica TaxID=400682 RepID=A0A1X7VVH7_AMPQE|nr:PREDICTED: stress response protein NST1-like [Amphimedon queenslandica]|eukprot:XP_011403833.1 PREDICTED: stress response protein NST1-like [Amphimedon queenslandica]